MIIEVFVLSVLIGLIRKGRLYDLGRAPLRHLYMFVPPLAILAGVVFLGRSGGMPQPYLSAAKIVQYAALLAAIMLNLHMRQMWLAAAGTFLNLLVIAANGGFMPMSAKALRMAGLAEMLDPERTSQLIRHAIMTPETRLKPLADIIPVPGYPVTAQVASIGDVLISLALFVFVQRYMLTPALDPKENANSE